MKYYPLQFLVVLLLLWNNPVHSQSPTTYSLEIHSIISEYGNTLGPVVSQTINDQWPSWEKANAGESDYHIKVNFLNGLDAKQYIRKKASRTQYVYQVKYITPIYDAVVTDKNGSLILQKTYGGTTTISPFGNENHYASPDTLAKFWKIQREDFYKKEEAKHNNVYAMLNELSGIIGDEETVVVAAMDILFEEITEPVPGWDEIKLEVITTDLEKEILAEPKIVNKEKEIQEAPEIKVDRKKINDDAKPVPKDSEKIIVNKEDIPETPNRKVPPASEPVKEVAPSPEPRRELEHAVKNKEAVLEQAVETTVDTTSIEPSVQEPVGGELPKIPEPIKREEITKSEKPEETAAEREARYAAAKLEWERMEEEDEKENKKPRVRHFRLGARMFVPNVLGAHGEVVLPVLNNRISIVGDFTNLKFGEIVEPFLDEDQNIDNTDITYRYFSVGANWYFRKKYARGWHIGASYLKGLVKSSVTAVASSAKGDIELDAAALRLGVNTGRGAFMFGFEIGAGIPLGNLQGDFYTEEEGVIEIDKVDEKVSVVPILNITIGVAL